MTDVRSENSLSAAPQTRGEGRAKGPLPAWLRPLGAIAEPIYRWEVARRNRAFDAGRGVVELDRGVVSVGNLSVGGTGKTPMVVELVEMLRDMGRAPCIAMRGYGARAGKRSDEEDAYFRRLPSVPIVARPDRVDALLEFFEAEAPSFEGDDATTSPRVPREPAPRPVDVVVLDDGFQHRRLARQLDLVMVDCTRDPFADRLLPMGWLREPVASLARANVVVLTHLSAAGPSVVPLITRRIQEASPAATVIAAEHRWDSLAWHEPGKAPSGPPGEQPLSVLQRKRALVCCAIGNPERLIAMVERATGVPLAGQMVLRDHDPFEPATIGRLLDEAKRVQAQVIVTTDKDWSKLRFVKPAAWPCAVAVPRLSLAISTEHRAALIARLTEALARADAAR
jgi:tetraacyldisaccharide 4'-kinase